MINIAIFASGKGSNADNLCGHFMFHAGIRIALITSDRKAAGVFDVAAKYKIPSAHLSKEVLQSSTGILDLLTSHDIHFIVLAGYLKLMPVQIIHTYNNRILNIHPALLPNYGGKGMFGRHVHQAVFDAHDTETGITIHLVNEEYDKGTIVFQTAVKLNQEDTPDQIAAKVHQLEMKFLPGVVEKWILESPPKNSLRLVII